MKNIISIIGLLIVAASAIEDVIAIESSSKPTAIKDNQLMRRRKTKSAKSSDSSDGGGDITTISDAIPFIEDTPDDDASMSMSMSMPDGVDDPFIGLADSDASMSMPDIDSSTESTEEEEEEESAVAYGDTKDGATIDQWHALVSTLDATHESYTPPDADTDASVEEEETSDSTPSRADSPWHDFMSTLDVTHESYTPPPAEAESVEDTDGEDTSVEEEEMSMSSTASSMSMPPGDGREDNNDGGSSKARKLSTAHDTIHGRKTKFGLSRMKTKMNEDELPWGDDSDHSLSMSVPIRVSEAQYTAAAAADTEEVHSMPNSKSSKGKTWKTKSAKAKSSKADDHNVMSMPHSKSGKAKSSKRF